MKKLGGQSKSRAWLKGLHMVFCCAWVGTAFSMLLLMYVKGLSPNGDELSAILTAIKLLDDVLIIPAALGTFITGLLICGFTHWGFFKYPWVIVKWVVTLVLILFGTFALGPWVNEAVAIADVQRAAALYNATYIHLREMNLLWGTAQLFILLILIFITTLKPWGKRGKS